MDSSPSSRTNTPTSPSHEEDNSGVFSMSDHTVSQELDFVEEIGNGNWGSVWLVKPKRARLESDHPAFKDGGKKFAVKLVHRKKTAANASRIKSLWNEMKIVRAFKDDRHPSIIPFHSFVITASFAMITMTYLPTPMPVEVEEPKAREWFRFLLSAVDFLHRRGVVHNDIKPANILLSHKNIPVLVDFGFAEKNDPEDETSFHSNLAYGTPEYLSPERARGLPHDTRKSDVWSLGVTFFEILNGRTPFEEFDGDQLSTKEAVERYWSRTLRGKWVGKWDASPGLEKLLHRMMSPNADLRCTAAQALTDRYWTNGRDDTKNTHRRSSSAISSIVFEKDLDKLLNMTPPSSRVRRTMDGIDSPLSPPGLDLPQQLAPSSSRHSLVKSRSQPKVAVSNIQPRKRPQPFIDLSPIKASPPASPYTSAAAKENAHSAHRKVGAAGKENASSALSRRVFGTVVSPDNSSANIPPPASLSSRIPIKKLDEMTSRRRSGIFDTTRSRSSLSLHHKATAVDVKDKEKENDGDKSVSGSMRLKASNNVKDRVLEWEREKQRLREMERLEEFERERDEHFEKEKQKRKERKAEKEKQKNAEKEEEVEKQKEAEKRSMLTAAPAVMETPKRSKNSTANVEEDKENGNVPASKKVQERRPASPPVLPLPPVMSPLSRIMNTFPAPTPNNTATAQSPPPPVVPTKRSKQNIFKHSIKASIDKTVQFCKASSIGKAAGAVVGGSSSATPGRGFSFDIVREVEKTGSKIHREEVAAPMSPNSAPILSPVSPLGPIKNAAMTEQAAAETHKDRMAIWMKNVEQVVEEAQANFEAMAPQDFSLPPLPLPLSRAHSKNRANRSSRLPRRALAASQIFDENGAPSPINSSFDSGGNAMSPQPSHQAPPPPSSYSGPGTPRRNSESSSPAQDTSVTHNSPSVSATSSNFVIPEIVTPSKQQKRRATVSTRSPQPLITGKFVENLDASASTSNLNIGAYMNAQRNHSQSTLNKLGITPLALQEGDYKKSTDTLPKLADVVDRNLFMAPPFISRDNLLDNSSFVFAREPSFDDLTASPYHVEPYPSRKRPSKDVSYLDSPNREKMENVYDRFLMTSGVKRHGKGYQSDAALAPIANTLGAAHSKREGFRPFASTRKQMPPPVSSEDIIEKMEKKAVSVDELGMMSNVEGEAGTTPLNSVSSKDTVSLVRRAFKAMVPGKAVVSKRLSRVY